MRNRRDQGLERHVRHRWRHCTRLRAAGGDGNKPWQVPKGMVAVMYPDGPAVRLRRQRIEVDKGRPCLLWVKKRKYSPRVDA